MANEKPTEDELLASVKASVALVTRRAHAVYEANQAVDRAKVALKEAEAARDKATAAFQSHLHGHAVEVKVTQPKEVEDDCG